MDHDPPASRKWTPLGIWMLATGALTLVFGSKETSAFWVDGLQLWWTQARVDWPTIRRLVMYLDNGPKNSGNRTRFWKRMVEFVDWSGLEVRLVYDPPYHSKYNPIERCWGILENHWNGAILDTVAAVLNYTASMTWNGIHPVVDVVTTIYQTGVRLSQAAMAAIEAQIVRRPELAKWSIDITAGCPGMINYF